MKTLPQILKVKQVLAWAAIITVGMMMGAVIPAQAASGVKQLRNPVTVVTTPGKDVWDFVKIRDDQKNGKTPLIQISF